MTIGQVMEHIAQVQPGSCGDEKIIQWLRQLDLEIYEKIIKTHEGWEDVRRPGYTMETPEDTALLAPEPYDCIYLNWIESRIDYENAEVGRFNNANAAFEADRQEFAMWYNRTHMPLGQEARYF